MDDNIVAAMQNLIDQSPSTLIRPLKINVKKLMEVLEEAIEPWMVGFAAGHHHVFQQDVHPSSQGHGNPGLVPGEPPGALAQGGLAPQQSKL